MESAIICLIFFLLLFFCATVVFIVLYALTFNTDTITASPNQNTFETLFESKSNKPQKESSCIEQADVFTTQSIQPDQLKICVIIITDLNSVHQYNFQKLWQEWNRFFGVKYNITPYLISAELSSESSTDVFFNQTTRLVRFTKFEDSLVPGILQKTISLLEKDKTEYDWYIRTTASTFLIPNRLVSLLQTFPKTPQKVIAGTFMNDETFNGTSFVQGRFIVFNHPVAINLINKSTEMYSLQKADDILITQIGAKDAIRIELFPSVDHIYSMRSTNIDIESKFLEFVHAIDTQSSWCAVNFKFNGVADGSSNRFLDVHLFAFMLFACLCQKIK